jgi:hypothetical protein
MRLEDLVNVGRMTRHVSSPRTEPAVPIYGSDPFGQELAASQEWDEIDITAWRVYKRQTDNTYNVTMTSAHSVTRKG